MSKRSQARQVIRGVFGTIVSGHAAASNFATYEQGPVLTIVGMVLLAIVVAPWLLLAFSRRRFRRAYAIVLLFAAVLCALYLPANGRPAILPAFLHVDDIIIIVGTVMAHLFVLIAYGLFSRRIPSAPP